MAIVNHFFDSRKFNWRCKTKVLAATIKSSKWFAGLDKKVQPHFLICNYLIWWCYLNCELAASNPQEFKFRNLCAKPK